MEVFDTDRSGYLDSDELEAIYQSLKEKPIQNMLKSMDVQPESLKQALMVADIFGKGTVNRRAFAKAWSSMHEEVKESDIRGIHKHVNILDKKLDVIIEHLGLSQKTEHLTVGLGLDREEEGHGTDDPLAFNASGQEGDSESSGNAAWDKLGAMQKAKQNDPFANVNR